MNNPPAYALSLRPAYGLAGCGSSNQCGSAYGTPMGPYGLQYGLAQAVPPPPAPPSAGFLASLPSWWPYAGLGIGGSLALVGIVLMASK